MTTREKKRASGRERENREGEERGERERERFEVDSLDRIASLTFFFHFLSRALTRVSFLFLAMRLRERLLLEL